MKYGFTLHFAFNKDPRSIKDSQEAASGKLASTVSNHLPQFLFLPSFFSDMSSSKSNMYKRNWFKFNKEDFKLDYVEKNWNSTLNLSRNNIDFSFNNFFDEHE